MFCVVLISFYKKMTIKPQNGARYGSNNPIFFLHLSDILCFTYFYIRNNEGQVAQNTRGKTHGYMGQNTHRRYFAHKILWASCPTGMAIAKSINEFLNVHQ